MTEEEQSRLSQNVGTLQQQIQAAQQPMGTLEQSAKDSSTASKGECQEFCVSQNI